MSPSSLIHASDCRAERSKRQNCWFWSRRFFLDVQYSRTRFSWVSSFSRITAKKKENAIVWLAKNRIYFFSSEADLILQKTGITRKYEKRLGAAFFITRSEEGEEKGFYYFLFRHHLLSKKRVFSLSLPAKATGATGF